MDPDAHPPLARCMSAAVETPSGIPFSLGLFRAFAMLAETSSDSRRGVLPTAAGVSAPPPFEGDQPRRSATGSSVEGHGSSVILCSSCEEGDNIPRVTLPHLRAILEHGGGMSAADVSEICESVLKAESCMQQERPELQQQPTLVSGIVGISGVEEGFAVGVEGDACLADNVKEVEKRKPVVKDEGGRGAVAAGDTHTVVETAKTCLLYTSPSPRD